MLRARSTFIIPDARLIASSCVRRVNALELTKLLLYHHNPSTSHSMSKRGRTHNPKDMVVVPHLFEDGAVVATAAKIRNPARLGL